MRRCASACCMTVTPRLIGVEYIISGRLFEGLPAEEKRYWHSHAYEVTSGQLQALGVPLLAANRDVEKLVGTYGKTWHFWQVDASHPQPYGPPPLMMSFTADGQLDPAALEARDADCGCNTQQAHDSRAYLLKDLPSPAPKAEHLDSALDRPGRPPWCSSRPSWRLVLLVPPLHQQELRGRRGAVVGRHWLPHHNTNETLE